MNSNTRNETLAAATVADPRWASVIAHDAKADGGFIYSVRSTGVYCRPGCAARTPRPENVVFHASAEDARRAGFRPCRRCRPDEAPLAAQHAAMVAELCRLIESADEAPTLDELARHAHLSRYHLHRIFKAVTGLTPKAYARSRRGQRVRAELVHGRSVTDAIYGAGYNGSARFYAEADRVLGMTPSRFRAGGAGSTIRFAIAQCSLGAILVASSERGVCAIALGDDAEALLRDLQQRFANAELIGGDAEFESQVARVIAFVEAPRIGLDLPLDVRGSAFQQRVWQALREIPPGSTASYSDVAARIGAPTAVRAVAHACAANTLAVAIPCHRVVRRDGSLSGYRWGVQRKGELLRREAEHG